MSGNVTKDKWYNEGQFFSDCYIRGDNSLEGFTKIPRTLEERTKREVQGTINLTDVKGNAKILDVPCGYGRHSIIFAKRGFNVTGIDASIEFLEIAEERAVKEDIKINFVQGDMRDIKGKYHEKFDVVANLSYSFGFFENDEDNSNTMQQFYNALRKGGRLILHTDICPEMIEKGYRMQQIRTLPTITIRNVDYKPAKLNIDEWYNKSKRRMHGVWTIIDDEKRITLPEYSVRIYSQEEFNELCKKIGFRNIRFIGDWKESFDPKNHEELILVAEK